MLDVENLDVPEIIEEELPADVQEIARLSKILHLPDALVAAWWDAYCRQRDVLPLKMIPTWLLRLGTMHNFWNLRIDQTGLTEIETLEPEVVLLSLSKKLST